MIKQNIIWKRIIFISLIISISILVIYSYSFDSYTLVSFDVKSINNSGVAKGELYCYKLEDATLEDISTVQPKPDKSIFFHETSCTSTEKGKIWLGSRQACAVESAALMNPNMDVYLLYSSPGIFKFQGDESDRVLQALLSYSNINVLHLNYGTYINGTPVEDLYTKGLIEENADYAIAHASDILRYLSLWKYGGIYLDTDVVIIKSLENLPPNLAGAESNDDIAAGVFKFSSSGFGHKMVNDCLKHLRSHFNPYAWSESSVGVISSVARTTCNIGKASDLFSKDCGEFKLYPMEYFYAIHYSNWPMFFNEQDTDAVLQATKDSFAIHIWNKLSFDFKVNKTFNTAYNYYAKRYCPKVFSAVLDKF